MWDARYADEYAYGTQPNDWLVQRFADLKSGRCLCLADGQGRNGVWLAEQGFAVTSVDLSPVGLEKARALADSRGVAITTELADLATYDMGEGRWDAIVSIFAHLPPALREDVHARAVRALVPGGTLLLEAYTPDTLAQPGRGGPKGDQAAMLMRAEYLLNDFAGLDVLHAAETVREVNEGAFHQGLGAVVQFLARKPGS
ncbi:class I SAM-dependent methyltransferase [Novosphingobium sp. 1949]|uniref:Class I SAM-dependent methyltransferase n=1 Tax=Novosphingobium organovorum TaxID=2930092 RepID=A0ABT0BAJ6_9SPHN|nr:class I SAM-dependent methyltransferase [Novosphingobium organovorum]MCJ2182053.1 class I SAM-dependent methyltransferase [Novosphingobium organovorum]